MIQSFHLQPGVHCQQERLILLRQQAIRTLGGLLELLEETHHFFRQNTGIFFKSRDGGFKFRC